MSLDVKKDDLVIALKTNPSFLQNQFPAPRDAQEVTLAGVFNADLARSGE
jgi:hypothetical protein